jgi:hypothetical protein
MMRAYSGQKFAIDTTYPDARVYEVVGSGPKTVRLGLYIEHADCVLVYVRHLRKDGTYRFNHKSEPLLFTDHDFGTKGVRHGSHE